MENSEQNVQTRSNQERKRLLFVTDGFFPAGGQRYLYEVVSNLKESHKGHYVITVLAVNTIKKSDHFYYKYREKDVEVKVVPLLNNSGAKFTASIDRIIYMLLRIRLLNNFAIQINKKKIKKLAEESDLIVFNQAYVLRALQNVIPPFSKVVCHLMSHAVQYPSLAYKDISINGLHLVYVCPQQKHEFETESPSEIGMGFYIPILKSMSFVKPKRRERMGQFTVGYIARVSPMKAFSMLLATTHELVTSSSDFLVKVIGSFENPGYYEQLKVDCETLQISGYIDFLGHAEDLQSEMQKADLDLIIAVSVNDFIGYSSIEAIEKGFPVVFWDLSNEKFRNTQNSDVIPRYSSVKQICRKINALKSNPDLCIQLINKQQTHVKQINSLHSNLQEIHRAYQNILAQ
jgi:glycosyltransferase involved in cell wall biosynthesis